MKVCSKCGTVAQDDSDGFCVVCGAYFEDKNADSPGPLFGTVNVPMGNVPEVQGGTIEGGIECMASGNYAGAMVQWTSYVRENGQPSEDDYRTMLDSTTDCIISTVRSGEVASRAGLAELAMELDADIVMDLTDALLSRIPDLEPTNIKALSGECIYMTLESFNIYPDMRDVLEVMGTTNSTITKLKESIPEQALLPSDNTLAILDAHVAFSDRICGLIEENVRSTGDTKMDLIADYWSTKATLPYVNIIFQLANQCVQYDVNKDQMGFFMKKLLSKAISLQFDAVIKSYFGAKV